MATQPAPGWEQRRANRTAKRAKDDAARRRVRTTSGRKRRRKHKVKLKIGGPFTMAWACISLTLGIVALITQSLLWVTFMGVAMGATAVASRVEARGGRAAVPPRPSKATPPPRPRARAGSPRPKRSSGTGGRTAVCSEACRVSKRPKSTCRCQAPECLHGSKAGVGA